MRMNPASAIVPTSCSSSAALNAPVELFLAEPLAVQRPGRQPTLRAPIRGPARSACSRRPARPHSHRARSTSARMLLPRPGDQNGDTLRVTHCGSRTNPRWSSRCRPAPFTVQPRWPASIRPISNTVSPAPSSGARPSLGCSGATITAMPMPQLKVRAISSGAMRPPSCSSEKIGGKLPSVRIDHRRGNCLAEPAEYSREVRRR